MERPGTAAAVASRPTSSWGFSSRQQGKEYYMHVHSFDADGVVDLMI